MPDDFIKLPLQSSLNRAATARAEEAIQNTGRALPCKVTAVEGSIVTVTFEANIPYQQPDGTIAVYQLPPITLAKAESQWMRSPTQVGDFGLTLPADTFLGGISGIGTGVADTGVDYGNLSGTRLVWVPVAALSFASAPSPAQAYVNGPEGVFVSDTAQTATHVVAVPTLGTPGTIASTIYNPAGSGATTVQQEIDGVNNKIQHALTNANGTVQHTLDGVNNTITHELQSTLGPVQHQLDGVNNKIQHAVSSATGLIQHEIDGANNAINHIVPTGGAIGLGTAAASLPSTAAALANVDLNTFNTSLFTARLNDLTALVTAMIASGVPNAGAILSNLATLGAIPVPLGSATVKIKP